MREADVAAATAYEDSLVPALFAEWAPRVVAAVSLESGDRVLDVGCGTGILAREASSRLGSNGSVAGLDANPGMLAVAARLLPGVDWRLGRAESLPFADRSFDVVVSQFSLMFFQDQHEALREMMRVLKPHGRLAVAVWDSLENIPAYAAEVPAMGVTLERDVILRVLAEAEHALESFASANGQVVFESSAHVITATRR